MVIIEKFKQKCGQHLYFGDSKVSIQLIDSEQSAHNLFCKLFRNVFQKVTTIKSDGTILDSIW